jgi:hypothetical protein
MFGDVVRFNKNKYIKIIFFNINILKSLKILQIINLIFFKIKIIILKTL